MAAASATRNAHRKQLQPKLDNIISDGLVKLYDIMQNWPLDCAFNMNQKYCKYIKR